MRDYKTFFLKEKNESWRYALDRYKDFLNSDMKNYSGKNDYSYRFIDNSSYQFHLRPRVPQSVMTDFTKENDMKVPFPLINMMCNYGTFKIGSGIMEVFDDKMFRNLSEMLMYCGAASFINSIGLGVLTSLNQYYYFFGISFPESEEPSFLYFNKSGYFGKMTFARNNPDYVLKKILPSMFNGSIERFTLDSLISNQVDRVITSALVVRGYID
ncbi:hypothetical protein [Dysgonomonas sp. 520]|uniref:hypothetical protein n=1 Tax=Dysgonomonas sp. 520 TaxID=2302931 RepID=UPI0013D4C7F6|nr:hypothetical protein [Dysgonomonas sp. 520]